MITKDGDGWIMFFLFLLGCTCGGGTVFVTQKFLMKDETNDDVPRSVTGRATEQQEHEVLETELK